MQPDEALASLRGGAAQIISEHELREKLALGRPLRVALARNPDGTYRVVAVEAAP